MGKRGYREWRTTDLRFVAENIDTRPMSEIAMMLGCTSGQLAKFVHDNRETIEEMRRRKWSYKIKTNNK